MQELLEKQWQVDNQRPLTPEVQSRLGSQVAQLVNDNVPAEELAQGASTTSPPLTPTQDPPSMAPARSSLSSERYDAGPMLAGGPNRARRRARSGTLSPIRSSSRSSVSSMLSRSSRHSFGTERDSNGSFSGSSVRSNSSLRPMSMEEILALDAGVRSKMEQAGVTGEDVKRQLVFKARRGRPIVNGRCHSEDFANTLHQLGVNISKKELRSLRKRFTGPGRHEIESFAVLDHIWSDTVMLEAARLAVQPTLFVSNIADACARVPLLRAAFARHGEVAQINIFSQPFNKSCCTVTYSDQSPMAASKALMEGVTVKDSDGVEMTLNIQLQSQAAELGLVPSDNSDAATKPRMEIGGNEDYDRSQALLQVTDIEDTLRKSLVEAQATWRHEGSATPFMLRLLDMFEKADQRRHGRVPAEHLNTVFSAFGTGLHENAYTLLAAKYNYEGDTKLVDYHRLMGALCPPQLSMEDKSDVSDTQKFVAGDAELENVTGSFFDVAEKIKEEVKGNRLQLVSCFERLDPEETGTLTVPQLQSALRLLRVGLSEAAIGWHFAECVVPDSAPKRVDYRRVMAEMFEPDEEFYDGKIAGHELDHVVNKIRHTVAAHWGRIVETFRARHGDSKKRVSAEDIRKIMFAATGERLPDEYMAPIFTHLDAARTGTCEFSAFLDLFSPPRWQEGVRVGSTPVEDDRKAVLRVDVQTAKELVREAVISRAGSNPKTALTNSFKYFDRDRNGRIDYDEIALSIENAGIKFESSLLAKLMVEYDPKGKGTLDFSEFAERIMGASINDGLTLTKEALQAFQATARLPPNARSWDINELEKAIKLKMERKWSQIQSALRDQVRSPPFARPIRSSLIRLRFCAPILGTPGQR